MIRLTRPVSRARSRRPPPAPEGKLLFRRPLAQPPVQQHAIAADEPARRRQVSVLGDEIGERQAIAVEEDDVVAGRDGAGAIAGHRGAKAVIGLPDMAERKVQLGLQPGEHLRCLGCRAVVGDQHLEVARRLRRQPAKNEAEGVRAVIGRNDDADPHAGRLR